ncbi:DUF6671 family protein [Candidatus Chromulinivorax destructor]|uniref:DUF6671 domain-containing protein n=1 Tax=Candidatus Chromulinivorax destructor TaxID=2066483 RepID=A0A345ZCA1_9BACT|nr:DUF6671 family protein [Candidatus Chromulinivorax destructor]AXK60918.1 hypothetical protein C0J27_04190 [Candidatus Chromulinivorax destructor]
MNKKSPYAQSSIVLTTKHEKSRAIAPSFLNILSAQVVECSLDTDQLGTFSGEIERKGSALDCAKIKCELGLNLTGSLYGLSSEGSFGPHPYIPFIPCNHEILYFIDRQRGFDIHLSLISEKTNYTMQSLDSIKSLDAFCKRALFPSHALIVSPDMSDNNDYLVKGITTKDDLYTAFDNAMKHSQNGKVLVQTDMRAHMNPSRMMVIQELAEQLSQRLLSVCIKCNCPGWGKVDVERGLECSWCGLETDLIKSEIYGCPQCDYQEKVIPFHKLRKADPGNCSYCNP